MTVSRAFFKHEHIWPTEEKIKVKTKSICQSSQCNLLHSRVVIRNCSPFKEVCLAMGIEQLTVCLHNILSFLHMLVQFHLLQTSTNLLVMLEQDLMVTVNINVTYNLF